jgi:hypothetical protein
MTMTIQTVDSSWMVACSSTCSPIALSCSTRCSLLPRRRTLRCPQRCQWTLVALARCSSIIRFPSSRSSLWRLYHGSIRGR